MSVDEWQLVCRTSKNLSLSLIRSIDYCFISAENIFASQNFVRIKLQIVFSHMLGQTVDST